MSTQDIRYNEWFDQDRGTQDECDFETMDDTYEI